MKKICIFLLCAAIFCCLAACGAGAGNDLFAEASPDTSVLTLYVYEHGQCGESGWISNLEMEREILRELSSVNVKPAEGWSPSDVTYPIYALTIGSEDGLGVHAVWSNGYLIMRDGSAWRFEYDFPKFREERFADAAWDAVPFSYIPCARHLAEGESGWNSALMTSAEPLTPPESVTIELVNWTKDAVEVKLANEGSEEWLYGEYFSLQVLLDGVWYHVPPTSEMNWGFTDIAYILAPGETRNESYSLMMYGDLPEGQYRLVVEGLSVEN